MRLKINSLDESDYCSNERHFSGVETLFEKAKDVSRSGNPIRLLCPTHNEARKGLTIDLQGADHDQSRRESSSTFSVHDLEVQRSIDR